MQRTSGGRSTGRRTRTQPQFGNERRDLSAAGPGRALQGRRGVEQGTEGEGRKRGTTNSGRERDRTASEAIAEFARTWVDRRTHAEDTGYLSEQGAERGTDAGSQDKDAEPEGDQSERARGEQEQPCTDTRQ